VSIIVLCIFAFIPLASGYSVETRSDDNCPCEDDIFFSALVLIFRRSTFEEEQLAGAMTIFALRFKDSPGYPQF